VVTRTEEVKFTLSAEDSAAIASFKRINDKLEALLGPINRVKTNLGNMLDGAGFGRVTAQLGNLKNVMASMPILGTTLFAGGLLGATKMLVGNSAAAVENLGKLNDLSEAYKVSTKSLQIYREIGADVGVDVETIAKGFGFLQKQIAKARGGDETAINLLASVGVNQKDLQGSVDEVFSKISTTFKNSQTNADDALKVMFAKDVFGKAGIGLVPVLEKGGEEYKKTLQLMQSEGRIFSEAEVQAADGADDRFAKAKRRMENLKQVVGVAMVPMLESIGQAVDKLLDSGGKQQIIDTFESLGKAIAKSLPIMIEELPNFIKFLSDIFEKIQKIGQLVGWDKLIKAVMFMLASPFLAAVVSLTSAFAGLGVAAYGFVAKLAIAPLMTFLGGILATQTGLVALGFSASAAWALTLGPLIVAGVAIAGIAALIYSNWGGFVAFFSGVWEGFTSAIGPALTAFEPLNSIVSAIGAAFSSVFASLSAGFNALFGNTNKGADAFKSWGEAGKTVGNAIAQVFIFVADKINMVLGAIEFLITKMQSVGGFLGSLLPGSVNLPGQASTFGTAATNSSGLPISPMQAPNATGPVSAATPTFNRQEVSGKMDIRIMSDGRAQVERAEGSKGFDINTRTGSMFALGSAG
jgi:hypothetical protein